MVTSLQDATTVDQELHPTLHQFIKLMVLIHGLNGQSKKMEIKLHSNLILENIFQDVTTAGLVVLEHLLIPHLFTSPHFLEIHMLNGLLFPLQMENGLFGLTLENSLLDATTA